MAAQPYPQIPASVWWGVREILHKSPSVRLDSSLLGAKLGVQEVAAKQYIAELRRIGILDEDLRPTDLAGRWRIDDTYSDAVEEIASAAYPEALAVLAPPGNADRSAVKNWFMAQGLGEGAANNKAATYLLVTSPEPGEFPSRGGARENTGKPSAQRSVKKTTSREASSSSNTQAMRSSRRQNGDLEMPALNVNVQIHISSDATNEQIESIFASMRKYLRDD